VILAPTVDLAGRDRHDGDRRVECESPQRWARQGLLMVAKTGVSDRRHCRRPWGAGLVVVGLLAAGLAGASPATAATVVTHSAQSGTYEGGRLTLRGVSGRVTYIIDSGRTGTVSVKQMHRRLFPPGAPATATLHLAGLRGGDEPTFRLSDPRYSAKRHTVSYRARPLGGARLPSGTARAAGLKGPREFGAASLSIVGHPRLGGATGNGGNNCEMYFSNFTETPDVHGNPIQLVSADHWDTDDWAPAPGSDIVDFNGDMGFASEGGLWRGCALTAVFHFIPRCYTDGRGCGPDSTFTFTVEWDWNSAAPRYTCKSSNPAFKCQDETNGGVINWYLVPA
jgi:hypothetical protein